MCMTIYHTGSAIDYPKDVSRLEEDCSGSSGTFTLGPFGAFSLNIQPSLGAAIGESNDTPRDLDCARSSLDTIFTILEGQASGSISQEDLHSAQAHEYEAVGQLHSLDSAIPDLTDDRSFELSLECLEGSDVDVAVVWRDLDLQQSSTNLFSGLHQNTLEETQDTFVAASASSAERIHNGLITIDSTYLGAPLSCICSETLPHIDNLLDLFKSCYCRSGSTWQILQMPEIQKTLGQIALKVTPSIASSAVLHAVLAVMSFHMDRLNTTEPRTGYWWQLGETYMAQAVTGVRSPFDDSLLFMDKARYKTSLMALLTVVSVCVSKPILLCGS